MQNLVERNKKKYCKYCLIALYFFLNILSGCSNRNNQNIQQYLGLKLPDNRNIKFFKLNILPDYKKPFCIFIKFKSDTAELFKIISDLNLVGYKSDFKELMCLQNVDSLFISSLWNFKTKYDIDDLLQKKDELNWWVFPTNKNYYYASFYCDVGNIKTERCYKKEWNGRVLLSYDIDSKNLFILIEVYG